MNLLPRLKARAAALGLAGVGVIPIAPSLTHAFYRQWLAEGHGGGMEYLVRHMPLKVSPALLMPEALCLIAVTLNYNPGLDRGAVPPGWRGLVARYAWGQDYHTILRAKLEQLAQGLGTDAGRPVRSRVFVDTGPLLEREFAARAGLGWVGKNGNLIHREHGSWLLLGELLVDISAMEFGLAAPEGGDPAAGEYPLPGLEHCGTCRACLDACPTGAIIAERKVDSRRCLSYLTIELKGPIPPELRPALERWVFGCDICQEVCPWNRHAPSSTEPALAGSAEDAYPSLAALLTLDARQFKRRFGASAVQRAKRRGLVRNAAIVLGNLLAGRGVATADDCLAGASASALAAPQPACAERKAALQALQHGLRDEEALVRGACAWALGNAAEPEARQALERALAKEAKPVVREELHTALSTAAGSGTGDAAGRAGQSV